MKGKSGCPKPTKGKAKGNPRVFGDKPIRAGGKGGAKKG